jgi:hypothetical protein
MPLGTIQVPFPDSTMPGTPGHFQESGGRIINSYIEPLGPTAPSTVIYRRAPGLRNFGTTVRTGWRGGIQVAATLYTAWNNRLVTFSEAGGAAADVGVFTGTAKGFFARNNRVAPASPAPPDIVFVDPDGNSATINGSTIGALTRPTDMGAPNSVCAMDGFFVFTVSDGKVWASDNNAVTIPALSFGTAENKPDGLIRGVPWAGQLFLFGPSTTEVWANAGTTPFPFQRSVVIPRGIAGSYCVSGFEDNFSRALVWVADDNSVVRLNGYLPEKISPPDLDGLIEREPAVNGLKQSLEMSCFISRGHAFILLSSPTWSWVFDLNTNKWAERFSYLQPRSRITGGVFAFNKWLCGDLLSSNVQEITNLAHTEIGQPFRWRIESGAVENFPVGARVGRFDAEFVTGVGQASTPHPMNITEAVAGTAFTTPTGTANRIRLTVTTTALYRDGDAATVTGVGGTTEANGTWPIDVVDGTHVELNGSTFVNAYTAGGVITGLASIEPIETDPVVEISWSDDGGQTYYAPIIRKLGKQAQTRQLVSLIACTGRSSWNARRWRLTISDPVYVGFMAAYQARSPKVSDIG